ncbi:hypothetical protein MTR67_009008 [Solanum verrucosum]|uniref:Uncharacterized protein n=1 Tax=Solanum verrucosum TaxID=315347 RepID=A0AAF0TGX3_SOLVR|nr:hypothetical protein MTR67_009008 [Solanum verrucosum]
MIKLREGTCYPKALMGVNVGLASVDALIAVLAFAQVLFFLSTPVLDGSSGCYICGVSAKNSVLILAIVVLGVRFLFPIWDFGNAFQLGFLKGFNGF